MVTTCLYDRIDAPRSSVAAVRRWLRGRWALLFSHPDDFASYGFESDRWVVQVQEAFASCNIAAIGVEASSDHSWIHEVGGCFADLDLPSVSERGQRFVAFIDSELRVRRVITYASPGSRHSPIDLAFAAAALRSSHQSAERATQRVRLILTAAVIATATLLAPVLLRDFKLAASRGSSARAA